MKKLLNILAITLSVIATPVLALGHAVLNPAGVPAPLAKKLQAVVDRVVLHRFVQAFLVPIRIHLFRTSASFADTAFQTMYRQEFVAGFEQHVSLLRETVTTQADIKGNTCVFLVADSGNAEATTRGTNGLIPARADNLQQNSCILSEWHDLVRKTGFNVFASQGNQRAIMQMTSMAVINRKIDQQIITELATGTVAIGATGTIMTVSLFQNGVVKLQNASVPWDSRITLLCCPATLAYLEQAPEFTNAEYVNLRPYAGNDANWRDRPPAYRWKNALVVAHPNLPGKGTTAEKNYLYHQSAIGHAADTAGLQTPVGYNEEQDYSWARATMYMGAKLLQNSGVVVITTDGSAYA